MPKPLRARCAESAERTSAEPKARLFRLARPATTRVVARGEVALCELGGRLQIMRRPFVSPKVATLLEGVRDSVLVRGGIAHRTCRRIRRGDPVLPATARKLAAILGISVDVVERCLEVIHGQRGGWR